VKKDVTSNVLRWDWCVVPNVSGYSGAGESIFGAFPPIAMLFPLTPSMLLWGILSEQR